jgi:hypothetical protein
MPNSVLAFLALVGVIVLTNHRQMAREVMRMNGIDIRWERPYRGGLLALGIGLTVSAAAVAISRALSN